MSQQPGEAEGSHRVVGSVDAVVASGPDNVGTCGYCQTVRARPATHEGIHEEPVSDASLGRNRLEPGGWGTRMRCGPGCLDKQAPASGGIQSLGADHGACGRAPW